MAGVAIGLIMALLSIRKRQKPMLLIGILCISIAAFGSSIAPSLVSMQILYALNGVGSVIISAMSLAIIGEIYPSERRGKAVGWIVAAGLIAFAVGAPMTGLLTTYGNWRSVMLWFNLPVSIASLIIAFLIVPGKSNENLIQKKESFLTGCRQTFSNKSAIACLIGSMFAFAATGISTFIISFWRQDFGLTSSTASVMIIVDATSGAIGGVVAGRMINRLGSKTIGVGACLAMSALITISFLMPSLTTSWAITILRLFCYGMVTAAFASLTLDQIPMLRATVMSLRGAFIGIGSFLGITIGGLALNASNYQTIGIIFGAFGFFSSVIILLLAKDPINH